MPKRPSTAVPDFREPGGPDPSDGLFVTAPRNSNARGQASPRGGAMPPPLPRHRAPNATPSALPAQRSRAMPAQVVRPVFDTSDDEDDAETSFDSELAARFAATAAARFSGPASRFAAAVPTVIAQLEPTPAPAAAPVQPILPHYAYPSPAPLPPEPTVPVARASYDLPTQPEHAVPAPQWHGAMATERVDVLTPPHMMAPVGALPANIDLRPRFPWTAIAFCGAAIAIGVIAGVVAMHGRGGAQAASASVAASPALAPVVAPAKAAAPTVSPVTPSQAMAAAIDHPMDIVPTTAPVVTSTGEAIGWKPTVVQPTIAAAAPVAVAPVAAAPIAAEIEMDVAKPVVAKRTARRAAAPKVVAIAKAAPAKAAPVKAAPAKATPKALTAKADKRASAVDPIEAAIAAPTKNAAASGDGPGRVTITSTPVALIYVDGRSTNMMTPKTLTLAPGAHKITLLEMSSRKAKTQDIDVPAGGALSIAKKF